MHHHHHLRSLFLSMLLLLQLMPNVKALNQQGLYLLRAKQSLSDPTGSLSSWNPRHQTPCNWSGITCNNNSSSPSVVAISLPSLNIGGPFPAILCRLPSLSSLSLADNFINSSLPSLISTCRSLAHLDLSQNLLVGPIPSSLSSIDSLIHLDISGNSLSGNIPKEFGYFRNLETLILNGNYLTGNIPAELGNVTTLKTLELAYNPFSPGRLAPELGNISSLERLWASGCSLFGQIPGSFVRLIRLYDLDVSNNRLTGSIPNWMFQLTELVQVELFNNSFTGELMHGWSNLTELRRFDGSLNLFTGTILDELTRLPWESLALSENQLEGPLPDSISQSPNLYELRLFRNKLNGTLPSALGKNSALYTLDVSGNAFSGKIPSSLCEKGALSELVLMNNMFSGEIPSSLGDCKSLTRVRLSDNSFNGQVPAEFWNLPHVYLLDLVDNEFSGPISHRISGALNLSTLWISKNLFSGNLPNEIGYLSKLMYFSGTCNKLSGSIPKSLVYLGMLEQLDLSHNELSGQIPPGIQGLRELNELNLAGNSLSGEIPDEIGNLPGLNYLDLSGNNLSGKIPVALQNLKLNTLNLSNNNLTGPVPYMYAKEVYKDSFLGNPGLCGYGVLGICPKTRGEKSRHNSWNLAAIFTVVGIVFIVGFAWFLMRYRKIKETNQGMAVVKWRSFHKLGFSEFDIIACLKEDNVIGSGASGKVYKAVLGNGEVVAVKKLWERSNRYDASLTSDENMKDEFESEVETLGKIRHKNIVRLWCCCNAGNSKLLVYEYMPNGSLGDVLHSSKGGLTLDWPKRFNIALDAAEGLSYLHHDCVPPIVHRDVKSNNILLDGEFRARIADFGVAKFIKAINKGPQESMSVIAGSCGYIAPEYAYTLRVNEKSDTYSFGVVILELVTGKPPIDPNFGEKDLAAWVRVTMDHKGPDHVTDHNLDSFHREQIHKVLDIGLLCISPLPINRPSMRRVVKMLQEAGMNLQLEGSNDGRLSPYYHDDASDKGSVV